MMRQKLISNISIRVSCSHLATRSRLQMSMYKLRFEASPHIHHQRETVSHVSPLESQTADEYAQGKRKTFRMGSSASKGKVIKTSPGTKSYPVQKMKIVGGTAHHHHQHQQQQQSHQQQQPPAPTPDTSQKKQKNLSDAEIKAKLKRYVEIEKELRECEAKNTQKSLLAKKEQLKDISATLAELEKHYRAACDKVAKEKADVDKMNHPSVKSFFKDEATFQEKMSKEQEEYLEAVSEQEVVQKQFEGIQSQKTGLEKEIGAMAKDVEKLMALYDEQDQILDDIFSGQYGSELENKLEEEVDNLLDRRARIGVAKYKWVNGRLLLQHACNQLAFATRRWQTLAQVPPNNVQVKYQLATETRNNLIAATQNIMSAKRYLNNIKFPYCEPEEIATLDTACSNVYIDMQSPERHQVALQCYSVTHRRAAALLQWFDNVINDTIEKDLAKAKAELVPKEKELRAERLRLIKNQIDGEDGDIGISDKDLSDDYDDDLLEPELVAISQPDKVEGESGGLTPGDDGQMSAPTPLPLNELAPPPSQEDLFGDIEQLKKQHEHETAQLEKARETNKARMEQGLQEKLKQRRSKRRRMLAEE